MRPAGANAVAAPRRAKAVTANIVRALKLMKQGEKLSATIIIYKDLPSSLRPARDPRQTLRLACSYTNPSPAALLDFKILSRLLVAL